MLTAAKFIQNAAVELKWCQSNIYKEKMTNRCQKNFVEYKKAAVPLQDVTNKYCLAVNTLVLISILKKINEKHSELVKENSFTLITYN